MNLSETRIENSEVRITPKPHIKSFEDLIVWQKARELTLSVYLLTKNFPVEERYGLSSQMRRASISVTSNIAEGFGRSQRKDKEHYYVMALGSLSELLSQLIISKDLEYIDGANLIKTKNILIETRKLLTALVATHRCSIT